VYVRLRSSSRIVLAAASFWSMNFSISLEGGNRHEHPQKGVMGGFGGVCLYNHASLRFKSGAVRGLLEGSFGSALPLAGVGGLEIPWSFLRAWMASSD
jgi:hypothetical protein